MLDLPRYLLGVAEILALASFALLGGSSLRRWLLPRLPGPPAWLAATVISLALLTWIAELLGSFSLFEPLPYLVAVAVVGVGLRLAVGGGWGRPSRLLGLSPPTRRPSEEVVGAKDTDAAAREGHPRPPSRTLTMLALLVAALALARFGVDVKSNLTTGMTGFDSTWYHGPFAAGFFQSGSTWNLHFIAPQFLAWFYPANAEIFHAAGMLAFGRDVLSPLLNLGWFVGCLAAAWCIGRPYRVAPVSLALAAVGLSVPALADQAGEARNDIVGIFFLLATVAIAVNAREARPDRRLSTGALLVAGLAAGLAAGTKLNFLLPAAVLVLGLPLLAPAGKRLRALAVTLLGATAGGGYWYLRNLVHTGNPLPWVHHLGPIALPAPEQALGGREGHTVLSYLTHGQVWSDWFLPGLHGGLTIFWPLTVVLAFAGLTLAIFPPKQKLGEGGDVALRIAGLAGLAATLAWLVAPTSASGPEGMPRGFESGLRYLAPALVLGLALLPAAPFMRARLGRRAIRTPLSPHTGEIGVHVGLGGGTGTAPRRRRTLAIGGAVAVLATAIAVGYPVQRHYLEQRYANPEFTTKGLDAAFKWANGISNARIATTGTRQYPLYGADLSNRVQFVGVNTPHGGFAAPSTCRAWRRLLDAGHYDYVIATRDRLEPNKPPYPPQARWTEAPGATAILRKPPTVVFKLTGPLNPSACRN
jgi:hypothetical protein